MLSVPNSHNIVRMVLPNGITLLVYENHAARSVVIAGSLASGALYERPAHNGLASFTAAALMRGTTTRDFQRLHAELEDIAADLGFGAGVHRTTFSGKALAEDLPTLLTILADVLRHPTFPNVQIERLRGERLSALQQRMQDTRYRAMRAFSQTLYPPDHPYHYDTRGTLETNRVISVDDIRAFHAQRYTPQGMILVVVGDVHAPTVLEQAHLYLGDWATPASPPVVELPALVPPSGARRTDVAVPGKTQSDIVMGVVGPTRTAPDYYAAMVVNSILGQFGMMGRIGETVREKLGLAYYAYSNLEGGLGAAPWSVSAGVNPRNVDLAVERITDELRRITTELVSEVDLEDNQSFFIGRLPLQLESNEGIASTLLSIETFDLGLDYLVHYGDLIRGLTREDLRAAAQHYINPDAVVIGVAGPANVTNGT
jgi:zinc protease